MTVEDVAPEGTVIMPFHRLVARVMLRQVTPR